MAGAFRRLVRWLGLQPPYAQLGGSISEGRRLKLLTQMQAGHAVKRTHTSRYDELDEITLGWLEQRFPKGQHLAVHDVAASDGSTSVDLFNRVAASYDLTLRSSDYYDALQWVRSGGIDYIFDAVGEPLQLGIGSLAASTRTGAIRHLFRPLWRGAASKLGSARRIALHHPRALALAAADPRFTLVRESFFEPAPGPYHLVRALNAIFPNLGEEGARKALEAIRGTMVDGGVLVIGRHENFSVFGLDAGHFSHLARVGADNSEILRIMRALEGSGEPFWIEGSSDQKPWRTRRAGTSRSRRSPQRQASDEG